MTSPRFTHPLILIRNAPLFPLRPPPMAGSSSLSPLNRIMALILLVFSPNPHARTLYPLAFPEAQVRLQNGQSRT